MSLNRFSVSQFRCIGQAELQLGGQDILITGRNGAGKTSLLEAIYYLVRGRSFRQSRAERLIQHGQPHFQIFGELAAGDRVHRVGIETAKGASKIRINGSNANNLAEINREFVVEVIEPEIHRLISEGPEARRRFMDYGVFHVEPSYLKAWQRYRKALKQRNAALKQNQVLAPWDDALIGSAAEVDTYRHGYVRLLEPAFNEACAALGFKDIAVEYRPGWNNTLSMEEALASSKERDLALGTTHVGPHRAELAIKWRKRMAREQVSRGQQKLLATSFILAQTKHLASLNNGRALLLLDDPAAELDPDSLARVMSLVDKVDAQRIVTAIDASDFVQNHSGATFHVEQGEVVQNSA
ncbi:MAG: DNA replication/repair protein RecF [Pseudomonadota bacterium]